MYILYLDNLKERERIVLMIIWKKELEIKLSLIKSHQFKKKREEEEKQQEKAFGQGKTQTKNRTVFYPILNQPSEERESNSKKKKNDEFEKKRKKWFLIFFFVFDWF